LTREMQASQTSPAVLHSGPEPKRGLVRLSVNCTDWKKASTCGVTQSRVDWSGGGRIAVSGDDGVIITKNDRIRMFATRADLGASRPKHETPSRFMPGESFKVAAVGTGQVAAALVMNTDGLYVGDVFAGSKHEAMSLLLPKGMRVGAMALLDGRVLFLLERRTLTVFTPAELWDCPQAVLMPPQTPAKCQVHDAPPEMADPLVLLTRSMTALDDERIELVGAGCPATMLAVSSAGWTWLVRRDTGERAILVADGIAGCVKDRVIGYRAGRNDEIAPPWEKSAARTLSVPVP